ncbi:MAG: hypothetical protein ABI261_08275 [Ginsengibacter sp.]
MIVNELTYNELESVMKPILKLEKKEIIFNIISKTFHIPSYDKFDSDNEAENTGVKTMYKGFDLRVKNFKWTNSDKSEHPRIIIEFRKRKLFLDDSINQTKLILNDLKKICNGEIEKMKLKNFSIYGIGRDDSRIDCLYQEGTYNPNWEKQHKLSPLTITSAIIREKGKDFFILEFDLTAECYERKSDKTFLKEDWQEIFIDSAPMWF